MEDKTITGQVPKWSTGQVILATLFVVGVLLIFWLVYRVRLVIFLLFAAMILGTAIRPGVDWLRERGILRPAGVVVIYAFLTVLLIGFLYLVAPFFADQFTRFAQHFPQYYLDFRDWLLASGNLVLRNIGLRIPPQVVLLVRRSTDNGQVLGRVAQTFVYANLFMKGVFETIAVFLLAYYWTQESSLIIRSLLRFVPQPRRAAVREFIHTAEQRMGGYIRGEALLCLIVGSAALIAYTLIGLPFAPVLGIIAAVTELIPVIGPGLGAIPAILIALSVDPGKVIWVLVAVALIQGLENTFLVPHIMKSSMNVNPIIIILSVVAFGSVFGFLGALIALPAAAILQMVLDRILQAANNASGKDRAGSLAIDDLVAESQEIARLFESDSINGSPALERVPSGAARELGSIAAELEALLAQIKEEKRE